MRLLNVAMNKCTTYIICRTHTLDPVDAATHALQIKYQLPTHMSTTPSSPWRRYQPATSKLSREIYEVHLLVLIQSTNWPTRV